MKKLFALALALALALSLAACGGAPSSAPAQSAPASAPAPQPGEAPAGAAQLAVLTGERFDYAEEFRNGYAFAIRGADCGYVDTTGSFTVCYRYDPEADTGLLEFEYLDEGDHMQFFVSEEGLYPCFDNATQKWGYADINTGEMVIEPVFIDACPFSQQRAVAVLENSEGDEGNAAGWYEVWVINTAGEKLFRLHDAFELCYTDGTLQGQLFGTEEDETQLLDRDGNVLAHIPFLYAYDGYEYHYTVHAAGGFITRGDAGHVAVNRGDEETEELCDTYYVNAAGEVTARIPEGAQYGYAWKDGAPATFYCEDGLYGLFNADGAITPAQWADFYFLNGEVTFVTDDGENWYLIDAAGDPVNDEKYERGGMLCEGLISACRGGKWGYLKPDGTVAIDFQFAGAGIFSDGIAAVRYEEEGPWYYVDTQGEPMGEDISSLISYTSEEGFRLYVDDNGYSWVYAAE